MSRVIWKFGFDIRSDVVIEMPLGAKVISVQVQHGIPYIWAIVDPTAKVVGRNFKIYGTGHTMKDNLDLFEYIGTFQMAGGDYIWHMYMKGDLV